jgi:nucleoside-diphosphate-sugar epimerase
MTKVIALTGATGYVGRFVAAQLGRQDVSIRALVRPDSDRGGFGTSIEWVTGNLRSSEAIHQLVKNADAVVHLAYEHVPGRYRGGEGDHLDEWLDANVDGSLRLLTGAAEAGVERFIFLSSRAVFSQTLPGRELDESHPISPDTHYGAYKAAVEAFLKSFAHTSEIQTCSVRATGIYGLTWPLERSKWWGLIQAVLNDEAITQTRGGTEVHGEDIARVIWALLERPNLDIDTVHLSDLYITTHDVVRLVRQYAGKPGSLPDEPKSAPENVMVSHNLPKLGIQLGGRHALEATIAELVQAAQNVPGTNA